MSENIDLSLSVAEWIIQEGENLCKEFQSCKTEHARNKMRPRLKYMIQKLQFEKKELYDKFPDVG